MNDQIPSIQSVQYNTMQCIYSKYLAKLPQSIYCNPMCYNLLDAKHGNAMSLFQILVKLLGLTKANALMLFLGLKLQSKFFALKVTT